MNLGCRQGTSKSERWSPQHGQVFRKDAGIQGFIPKRICAHHSQCPEHLLVNKMVSYNEMASGSLHCFDMHKSENERGKQHRAEHNR